MIYLIITLSMLLILDLLFIPLEDNEKQAHKTVDEFSVKDVSKQNYVGVHQDS